MKYYAYMIHDHVFCEMLSYLLCDKGTVLEKVYHLLFSRVVISKDIIVSKILGF